MMSRCTFTLCFLATILSQLSAAPTPAPQYENYAVGEVYANAANGQYAADQMKANSQYAADQMKSNGQYAVNAGKNLVDKAESSIGNISLNPLNYMPTWMQPDRENLTYMIQKGIENGEYVLSKAKEKGQEIGNSISGMARSVMGQGRDLTKGGIQLGAQTIQSMGDYEKSYLGSLGEKMDSVNGYVAEKLFRTADGVGTLSIPNLDQQLYYTYY